MSIASFSLYAQNEAERLTGVMNLYYPADEPGAALLVIKDGKTILRAGYGLADMETKEKIDADTHFRMASVSKQFTAMCILLPDRQKKLSIHDPVRKYLPSLPTFMDDITIHHFLTHTSGIADYEPLIPKRHKEQVSDADVLKLVSTSKQLYFKPGEQYKYSNTAFCLLTLIVEKVTGMPYAEFIRQNIFIPLLMEHSVMYNKNKEIYKRAFGYHLRDGQWIFADQSITSATLGDGSVYTSLNEYEKWIHYLWKEKASHIQPDPMAPYALISPGIHYGYGWFTAKETDGSTAYFHSGESTGFHNIVYQNPSKKLLIVMFSNCDDDRVSHSIKEVLKIMQVKPEIVSHGNSLFDLLSSIYGDE